MRMKTITGSLVPCGKGMPRPVFVCGCKHVMQDYPLAPVITVTCPKCEAAKTFHVVEFAPSRWRIK
jgi:hypothetical protein